MNTEAFNMVVRYIAGLPILSDMFTDIESVIAATSCRPGHKELKQQIATCHVKEALDR